MGASPRFKIYDDAGVYRGSVHELEDAAILVGVIGGTVRDGHSPKQIIWTEGHEEIGASESYDGAAHIMWQRISERRGAR